MKIEASGEDYYTLSAKKLPILLNIVFEEELEISKKIDIQSA